MIDALITVKLLYLSDLSSWKVMLIGDKLLIFSITLNNFFVMALGSSPCLCNYFLLPQFPSDRLS